MRCVKWSNWSFTDKVAEVKIQVPAFSAITSWKRFETDNSVSASRK